MVQNESVLHLHEFYYWPIESLTVTHTQFGNVPQNDQQIIIWVFFVCVIPQYVCMCECVNAWLCAPLLILIL